MLGRGVGAGGRGFGVLRDEHASGKKHKQFSITQNCIVTVLKSVLSAQPVSITSYLTGGVEKDIIQYRFPLLGCISARRVHSEGQ